MALLAEYWPQWTRLYWLLCAPLALLLAWALYRVHKSQHDWRVMLPPIFHGVLLNMDAPRQRHTRSIILLCVWICALLALAGPSWKSTIEPNSPNPQAVPLVIVLQLTPDILATDVPPSRLHQVRAKVLRILEQRDAAFTAIVVYAGSAHTLVPLSNDLHTSTNLLQALQPDLMPVPGQRADLAIGRAVDLLQQGAQRVGDIILISHGVSINEQKAIAQQLKPHDIQLKIMGVGTLTGAPIAAPEHKHFLTDASGAVVMSRLNQSSLQLLGQHTQSPYIQLRPDDSDLAALGITTLGDANVSAALKPAARDYQDQGYWFILPILLLSALLARRGSFLLIVLCCLPLQSFAFEFNDLWLRPDQQGAKLLEQQPARAAQRFTDPLWRATALYLAQDYRAAAKILADFDTPQAHYNRGNALALAGLLEQAQLAYQDALNQAPEMLAAQYNLAIVQAHLAALIPETTQDTQAQAAQSESTDTNPSAADTAESTDPNTNGQASTQESQPATRSTDAGTQQSGANPALTGTVSNDTGVPTDSYEPEPPMRLESWLEQIPDNPSELLKRKFLYEQHLQETAQ